MKVEIIPFEDVTLNAKGIMKLDLHNLSLPLDFLNLEQTLIFIPPLQFGGNHKHPRREIFICLSEDVEFQWIDKNDVKHIKTMKENGQIFIFDVHPFIPHAIVNMSTKSPALLLEFANARQNLVEPYIVHYH